MLKKILIVEDEYLVRIGIKSLLNWEEEGYTVIGDASNGKEALEKIEKNKPHIVLTDLLMEEMDGFDLISMCRKNNPDIQFVVLSNYNDFENVKKAMKLGASDYIFKLTAKPEDILAVLNEIVVAEEKPGDADIEKRRELLMQNQGPVRTKLLKSAIQGSYASRDELLRNFRLLDINIDFSEDFVVFQLAINCFFRKLLLDEITKPQMLCSTMEHIAAEIITKHLGAAVFVYDNGQLLILVQCGGIPYGNITSILEDDFWKIREYCGRYLGIHVCGVISRVCRSIEDLADAVKYNDAVLHGYLWEEKETFSVVSMGGSGRDKIRRTIQYINHNLKGDLDLKVLAGVAGMSESYFSHIFKKETGTGVNDYVNRRRIGRAEQLLQETNMKISAVSQEAGIENTNYFSILFKKITGKTPNEYRASKEIKE